MVKQFTCIICPNGCYIRAESQEGGWVIAGEGCPRGRTYVLQEMTDPQRTIATSVRVSGGSLPLCSVRLTRAIPKGLIPEAMREIHALTLSAPVTAGTVLVTNLLGTGSDVIATRDIAAGE